MATDKSSINRENEMVLEIWDVVRIDETGENGLFIGDRDGRRVVSLRPTEEFPSGKVRRVSPLGLTRILNG